MQPTTSKDFQKAARQRLNVAEELLKLGHNLDAQYIGGYTVECSLKALILEKTPQADRAGALKSVSSGSKMHRPEVLLGMLRDRDVALPLELSRRMRLFRWETSLRYEFGRRKTGETKGLLKTASAIYHWVEEMLP